MRLADNESHALVFALYLGRVMPDEPRLLADDEETWVGQWRALTAERKARFEESLRTVGFSIPRKHLSRLQLIAARDAFVAKKEMSLPTEIHDLI